jgi:hypothetical protein
MNHTMIKLIKGSKEEFFSAKFFLIRAAVLAGLFLVVQLAGLREYTTFLSGTTDNPGMSIEHSELLGVIYILMYLGCVVIAPIFLLTGGMLMLWKKTLKGAKLGA